MLIRKLVECVSKGGNMILNVGPDANGRFNAESCRLLDEIGAWMSVNSESIYGCGSADVPKPDWGWYTKNQGASTRISWKINRPAGADRT